MTERQTRMEKLEEQSEGGALVVRIEECGVNSFKPAVGLYFHFMCEIISLNVTASLFSLFVLRFPQAVEAEVEEELNRSRPSSRAACMCNPS